MELMELAEIQKARVELLLAFLRSSGGFMPNASAWAGLQEAMQFIETGKIPEKKTDA